MVSILGQWSSSDLDSSEQGDWPTRILVLVLFLVAQCLQIGTVGYLKYWSHQQGGTAEMKRLLAFYIFLVSLTLASDLLRMLVIRYRGVQASKMLSTALTQRMLSCDVRVFDKIPVGRFMSRSSADLSICDVELPQTVSYTL